MIIAVANTKGGTGKTTTAVQLALYRQSLGHEVWLVDGDEQQSALTAVSIRSENGVKPALACSAYSDGKTSLLMWAVVTLELFVRHFWSAIFCWYRCNLEVMTSGPCQSLKISSVMQGISARILMPIVSSRVLTVRGPITRKPPR